MEIPHIIYGYDIDKDIKNIEIGLETIRKGREPDPELSAIIHQYGINPSREFLSFYLKEKWEGKKNIQKIIIKQLQKYWDSIEEKFFEHIKGRMQLTSFYDVNPINGFLSTRYGSGYDWEENWFAVSSHSSTMKNTMVAMHEIMHIFFHKQWWNFCKEKGLSDRTIWDVKEAATVLINLWFKNQLIDLDLGYEEHTDLRKQIKQDFLKSRDFKYTIEKACVYMRVNKEKSPTWM